MILTAIVIHGNNSDDFQAYMAKDSEGGMQVLRSSSFTALPLTGFFSSAICSNVKELLTGKPIKTLIKWEERGAGRVFKHHTKGGKSHNWKHGEFSLIAGWKERKWSGLPLRPSWLLSCEFRTNTFNTAVTKAKCKELNQCTQKSIKYTLKNTQFSKVS